MPSKVPFTVAFCGGAADDYPATDLEVHSPLVNGWQSQRYCSWPQELIFDLGQAVRIRKIQFLSHQFKIASRLEIYVGEMDKLEEKDQLKPNFAFRRLGHVSLGDNHTNGYKSRELKSVHIDVVARYVRVLALKCHVNVHNKYNQVGVIAVNIIGDGNEGGAALLQDPISNISRLVPDYDHGNVRATLLGTRLPQGPTGPVAVTRGGDVGMVMASGRIDYLGVASGKADALPEDEVDLAARGLVNRPLKVDPLNDLSFDVYQDPETAVMTRRVARLKQECVQQEKFHKAKQCNEIIAGLRKVGEELGRLGVIKKRAVEAEDFDTAETVRSQIVEFREKIYSTLGIRELFQECATPLSSSLSSGHNERKRERAGNRSHSSNQQTQQRKSAPRLPRTPPLPGIGSATTASHAGAASRFSSPAIKLVDTQSVARSDTSASPCNEMVVTMSDIHVKLDQQGVSRNGEIPNLYVVLNTNPSTIVVDRKENALKTQRAKQKSDQKFADILTCSLALTEAAQHKSDFVITIMDYDRFAEDTEIGVAKLRIGNLKRGIPFTYGPTRGGLLMKGRESVGTISCSVLLEDRSAFAGPVSYKSATTVGHQTGMQKPLHHRKDYAPTLPKNHSLRADSPASVVLTSPTESPAPSVATTPALSEKVTSRADPTPTPTLARPLSPEVVASTTPAAEDASAPLEVALSELSTQTPSLQPTPDLLAQEKTFTPEKKEVLEESKRPVSSSSSSAAAKDRTTMSFTSPTSAADVTALNSPELQTASPTTPTAPHEDSVEDTLKEEIRAATFPAIQTFGESVIGKVYSKSYASKIEGLDGIITMLSGDGNQTLIKAHSERTVVDAINLVFEHSLQDTRVQVITKVGQVIQKYFAEHGTKLSTKAASRILSTVLPLLLTKLGDTSMRARKTARESIIGIYTVAVGAGLSKASVLLLQKLKQNVAWREAQGRLEIVCSLVKSLTLKAAHPGLTTEAVLAFATPNVRHQKKEIRTEALNIAICVFHEIGKDQVGTFVKDKSIRSLIAAELK